MNQKIQKTAEILTVFSENGLHQLWRGTAEADAAEPLGRPAPELVQAVSDKTVKFSAVFWIFWFTGSGAGRFLGLFSAKNRRKAPSA